MRSRFFRIWATVAGIPELTDDLVIIYSEILWELYREENEAAIVVRKSIDSGDMDIGNWIRGVHYNIWPKSSLAHTVKTRVQARVVLNRIKEDRT